VPGVLSRIAVTEPPAGIAPMMPPAKNIAAVVSTPNVNGISNASAVGPPRPGMTPNRRPTSVPSVR
jgi:hypothetical protein